LRVKGKYRDDFKEGVWRFYDASGELEKKEHYHKGEKEFFE
jgi:antitoxin component YwqK of YwqJK toxin-antitoxin module